MATWNLLLTEPSTAPRPLWFPRKTPKRSFLRYDLFPLSIFEPSLTFGTFYQSSEVGVAQNIPMDIDPGKYPFFLVIFLLFYSFSFSEVHAPATSESVRLLPYSLVPGMAFSSPLFIKAISVISKQQSSKLEAFSTQPVKNSKFYSFS
jgi:hypothetical protein